MTKELGQGATRGARDALRWAATLREVRSSLCEQLERGTASLEEVMDARSDPRVGDVHLHLLLESLPGVSKVATRRRLASMDVAARTKIAELHDHEVAAVLAVFGGTHGLDPSTGADR
ncbi:MAG: hypothetical protein M5U19_04595 [Microthrixaceae bacterium]|nr:hypothetical protein [Microthrixaceae bacterium]